MGNIASHCAACSKPFLKSSGRTAVLLDTRSSIRKIQVPVKAAEIMIEVPGHVITPVDELRRTRRISALAADEDLVGGKAYMLVAATRLHSKATQYEMGITEEWDCQGKKNKNKSGERQRKKGVTVSGNMAKVKPIGSKQEEQNELRVLPIQCQRLGIQGPWNPVLDPIMEFP